MTQVRPEYDEWLTKEKIKYSLGARFLIRFHVFLILAFAVLLGWAANRAMYNYGVKNMLLRHPVALLASYVGFLAGVRVWIDYSGIKAYLQRRRARELVEPEGFEVRPQVSSSGSPVWDHVVDAAVVFPEGCFLVLAGIAIAAGVAAVLYAAGGYIVIHFADILAEVVFELLLAAGLVRSLRRSNAGWLPVTVTSLWAFAAALIVTLVFDLYAKAFFPRATTVAEMIKAMAR